jgi:hypothetical protein
MSAWTKHPALTESEAGYRSQCLNCGPQPVTLPLESMLAVGFGDCTVTRDQDHVYSEAEFEHEHPDVEPPSLDVFEQQAASDPDHDWRVLYYGPLSESEYQRQGPGEWVLIRKGMGFA